MTMTSLLEGGSTLLDKMRIFREDPVLRRLEPKGMPLLFGEEDLEMGESSLHTRTCNALLYGLEFHLADRPQTRVFSNLNLYYSDEDPTGYLSPDLMVVRPSRRLPRNIASFRIGHEGPAPLLVAEVLSFRTYHQGDLTSKPVLYASLGIPEYLLIDVTGELLPRRLLILRRRDDGFWDEDRDADGGITSRLGFRVVLEEDGQLRVVDAKTGKRYARPEEAQQATDACAAEAQARQHQAQRLRQLETEIKRLRGAARKRGRGKK
jgi:Uma2 family endonuclease